MSPRLSRAEVETAAEACAAAVDRERKRNRQLEPV